MNNANELIKLLIKTNNNEERNNIALKLSDEQCEEAVKPIIDLLYCKRTEKNKGTLLYALENLDYYKHLDRLIDFLFADSFEVRIQTKILFKRH